MKYTLLLSVLFPFFAYSQTIKQPCLIREISYKIGVKGDPIEGVRVKSFTQNESISGKDGSLFLPVTTDKDGSYTYEYVLQNGYVSIMPSVTDFRLKKFIFNKNKKIEIIMAKADVLSRESRKIEQQIRYTKETEIIAMELEFATLQKEIGQSSKKTDSLTFLFKRMQKEIEIFKSRYYNADRMIRNESERLSMIDCYALDSIDAHNIHLLKNGKGKELIKRNKRLIADQETRLTFQTKVNKVNYAKETEWRNFKANRYRDIADGFKLEFNNDSAAYYLELRAKIDPNNYQYNLDYGLFVEEYLNLPTKALSIYNNCLSIVSQGPGLESEQAANIYSNIGLLWKNQENNAKALEYYFKYLKIIQKILGSEHLSIAECYNNIGFVYCNLAEYHKALEYHTKALDIKRKVLGEEYYSTAISYSNLGVVYSQLDNYTEAFKYHNKALNIKLKVLGEEHPSTAISYNNIGMIFDSQGDYQKALEYYSKDMAISEKVLGSNHPSTAITYNNIGQVYYKQQNYSKSLEYFLQAISINEKALGENHPSTATCYNNIGLVYTACGDSQKALDYYFKALKIRKLLFGENHISTAKCYNNIGSTYSDSGDYTKAMEYFNKALVEIKKTFGENHSSTATCYNNIGSVYNKQKKHEKAIEYYFNAFSIMEKVFGKEHPSTAECFINMGFTFYELGKYDEAESCFEQNFEVYRALCQKYGKTYAYGLYNALETLALFYEKTNQVENAKKIREILDKK